MSKEGFLSESKNTIAGTDLVKRRRRRRAGATESSESIRSAAILSQLDHSSLIEQGSNGTGQLRRRRRRATAPKNSPVLKTPHPVRLKEPHPINSQQTQIETLAASMAAQTAKKFSGSCIPPQLQSALTVELLAAAATSARRTNRVLPEKPIGLGTESSLARGTGRG